MDRRRFLQHVTATAAAVETLATGARAFDPPPKPAIAGHTLVCQFTLDATKWMVYEDLRTRDGALTFVPSRGAAHVMPKRLEATFSLASEPHLGLKLEDIGLSGRDLLADRLLAHGGDPDPFTVRDAAPPLGSARPQNPAARVAWDTFVGTKECSDTMPVFPAGNTRTYHPNQYFPELTDAAAERRHDGLLGGWMPAVLKVLPISDTAYIEILVFGDVEARERFIVQTWHRTTRVENGRITRVVYGHSYPAYPPARADPAPEAFYRALLVFANYWEKQLGDVIAVELPDSA